MDLARGLQLFGEDDEEEVENFEQRSGAMESSSHVPDMRSIITAANAIFIHFMKLKSSFGRRNCKPAADDQSYCSLALIETENSHSKPFVARLHEKFEAANCKLNSAISFEKRSKSFALTLMNCNKCDVIIFMANSPDIFDETVRFQTEGYARESQLDECLHWLLRPGGYVLCQLTSSECTASAMKRFSSSIFFSQDASSDHFLALRRRDVLCNHLGASYWRPPLDRASIGKERDLLASITVLLSRQEVLSGEFSVASRDRALRCLREHGLCIFPSLFSAAAVLEWGCAAKRDMRRAVCALWEQRHIDLLHPYASSAEEPFMENCYELSMREALRCDLRNGLHVTTLDSKLYGLDEKGAGEEYAAQRAFQVRVEDAASLRETIKRCSDPTSIPPTANLRYHPGILSLLTLAMNPADDMKGDEGTLDYSLGNWG
jgi:hypothetical protein